MFRQAADRFPELGLRPGAEDFGCLAGRQLRVDEAESGSPGAVVVSANREVNGDELVGEAEGGKFMDDGIPGGGCGAEPVWLSRHRSTSGWGAVVFKDRTGLQVMQCRTPLLTGLQRRSKLRCFLGRQETPRHTSCTASSGPGATSYIAPTVT